MNELEIIDKWCLIDFLWDSGYNSKCHLCNHSCCFIINHLPYDNTLNQILSKQLILENFLNQTSIKFIAKNSFHLSFVIKSISKQK